MKKIGQFDDAELLYNHKSTEESDRIHHEYSTYFEKVEDQEYSPYHTVQGVKYHIPEPDYYHTNTQPKQYQKQQNQNVYLPPPPISKTYVHGMVEAEEESGVSNCMATDCMVKKQGHWKAD